ncbi:glycosyltransferase family 2 protein [Vreelandella populi]|uniref:Glycosyltransferase n=1 Tax=Vreelandella populi TaxID=2498858 RepID=A0A433LBG5_9GAMM|nr:glycosyltransferase family 2 protein [Halomonas populi]RUR42377.1 glycosyltransferase [Halomonas populi]RUR46018.1 glycosyltransferase [Halomonas populi]RUR57996.1 glycosyltransferase [Halomonas populi]
MTHDAKKPTLSLIVPVLDEEESIGTFLAAINEHLTTLPAELEILFVDDGSSDNTIAEIERAQEDDGRVRYIKLSRNFGKEAAMTAGLDHATGDAVIPMDVDLQDPPKLINEFFRLWQEGYDTVYGLRRDRNEDTRGKRASANMFYRVFNWLSHTEIPANTGDYRLMDRKVVEALKKLPERNRFMKGMFAWPGFSSIGVEYSRPARHAGQTKWNAWKLWNFAIDGLTSFSTWPLRVWTYIGLSVAMLSLIYMSYIIIRTIIFGVDWPGYASIMSAILFFGSVQLISIGVLGEYIGRLYIESKNRPLYLVERDSNINMDKS